MVKVLRSELKLKIDAVFVKPYDLHNHTTTGIPNVHLKTLVQVFVIKIHYIGIIIVTLTQNELKHSTHSCQSSLGALIARFPTSSI